jgi:pimeloyl-ACP methyl ester carboxylesterase
MSNSRRSKRPAAEADVTAWFDGDECRLAYWRIGGAGPVKLFYFHGSPGCRLEARSLVELLDPARYDLVAVDRPGMGLSRFQPGYDLASHSRDLIALADSLNWQEFGAVGYSGGGATLYSLAATAPGRMRFGIDVSGWAPVGDYPELRSAMPAVDQVFSVLASIWPYLVNLGFWTLASASRRKDVDRVIALLEPSLSGPDRAWLEVAAHRQILLETIRDAFRQGRSGAARDAILRFRPWGLDLSEINTPITLLHGSEDRMVPFVFAAWKSARLPRSRLFRLAGAGHLGLFEYLAESLDIASADQAARRPGAVTDFLG